MFLYSKMAPTIGTINVVKLFFLYKEGIIKTISWKEYMFCEQDL